ncbi:MAG TPA: type I phosphomannose isomerase catalytic subunit [Bryobacteraceae bacterium]|jgi:mannose-6-phosphate isomerase|nr:type I phosphomannose isomerase catalytic subunit [Bryobacteraceae bacterium]
MSDSLHTPAQPFRLLPIFRERVWGRRQLAPYFPDPGSNQLIGEAWLTFEENSTSLGVSLGELIRKNPAILGSARDAEHPNICPLLLKMLFTSERLSVQVHPDDEYARRHHGSLGKTEAWYVVAAEPPGEVAVGFREEISPARLRQSAQTGEIEKLLDWRKVQAGDVIYTPAGTVHAIGAGLTICEIQQHSDITYRLYDYGRPRELHLDHGVRVAHLGPHEAGTEIRTLAAGREELVASPYFRLERLRAAGVRIAADLPIYAILLCLRGTGRIAGEAFEPGHCWFVPAGGEAVEIAGGQGEWIVTYTAADPLTPSEISIPA